MNSLRNLFDIILIFKIVIMINNFNLIDGHIWRPYANYNLFNIVIMDYYLIELLIR